MARSILFPRPPMFDALEALLVFCRLKAILRGELRVQSWQGPPA